MNRPIRLVVKMMVGALLAFLVLILPTTGKAQPGSLDATFGNGGKLVGENVVRFATQYSGEQRVDIARQSDGKIVAVGGYSSRFAVFRFNADGTPDATFGTNGIAVATFQNGSGASAVAIQPDGKIVVGGTVGVGSGSIFSFSDFALARFNANGTLDASFGSGGMVVKDVAGIDEVEDLVIQPDGKIVFTGNDLSRNGSQVYLTFRLFAIRYNSDGTLDTAFGNSGIATARFGDAPGFAGAHDSQSLALQPDGKIVVVGRASNYAVSGPAIARFLPSGQLDNSFGTNGMVVTNFYPLENFRGFQITSVALQGDGKIILGGAAGIPTGPSSGQNDFMVLRYTSAGELDNSFDGDGITVFPIEAGSDVVKDVLLQPNGKIILAGEGDSTVASSPGSTNFALARLNVNGSLDTSLDGDGKAITDFINNSIDTISRAVLQPDGKILAVGFTLPGSNSNSTTGSLALARYIGDTPAASRPVFDFDGDRRADVSLFRPANGTWYVLPSGSGGFYGFPFGQSGDLIAPADYDGDGKTDVAVFRPVVAGVGDQGYFYILNSSDNSFRAVAFGTNGDVPTAGDWDGDRKADLAVYREGRQNGSPSFFYYRPSSQPNVNFNTVQLGTRADKPVYGDFDGDGRIDAGIFRPAPTTWLILCSSNNQLLEANFGLSTDIPVPADFDGDGLANIAVFRPSNGTWYTNQNPATNYGAIQFGANGDLPVPADYDGDGRADTAVFRPSNGAWFLNRTTSGLSGVQFGVSGDKPSPNAFVR